MTTRTRLTLPIAAAVLAVTVPLEAQQASPASSPSSAPASTPAPTPASSPASGDPRGAPTAAPTNGTQGRTQADRLGPAPAPTPAPPQRNGVTKPLAVVALESRGNEPAPIRGAGGGARGALTAVADPEPRSFKNHDLITIVVSEQSKAKSSANSKTDKKYDSSVDLKSFMNLDPSQWSTLITLGSGDMPQFDVSGQKKFDSKGDVARQDDFTAKITGEVIEVLPNGTIVVEAYKQITMDGETQTIRLSGRCRPEDVDATNSVQSNRLANASIEKVTKGDLRDVTQKGIIAKVLDTLFAF